MSLEFKMISAQKTNSMFDKIIKKMQNPGPALNEVAIKSWKDVQNHFRKEEGPEGKWQSLKPETIARRRKKSSKILQDTGNLRNRILYGHDNNDAWVQTSVKYAAAHNYGFSKKNIPQRQFLWLSKEAISSILKTLKAYILNK